MRSFLLGPFFKERVVPSHAQLLDRCYVDYSTSQSALPIMQEIVKLGHVLRKECAISVD